MTTPTPRPPRAPYPPLAGDYEVKAQHFGYEHRDCNPNGKSFHDDLAALLSTVAAAAHAEGRAAGVKEERERVVAWLSDECRECPECNAEPGIEQGLAADIERGEHAKGEGE